VLVGIGIDYFLFLPFRFREELHTGHARSVLVPRLTALVGRRAWWPGNRGRRLPEPEPERERELVAADERQRASFAISAKGRRHTCR
jgi:uncharacterized membrane protein YdfJ with MMPL/SSD domain